MKNKILLFVFLGSLCLGITSCISAKMKNKPHKEMAPGQKKKITKSKSAKAFAPGQVKKKEKHHHEK